MGIPAVPALMIVMDRSGSTSDLERFQAAQAAILQFVSEANPSLQVGLMRFPEGDFDDSKIASCIFLMTPECQAILADNGCKDVADPPGIQVAPVSDTKDAIATLVSSTNPVGGTPTRWALKSAWASLVGNKATGGRHVILISDGAPTVYSPASPPLPETGLECGTEPQILQEAKATAEASEPIFTHAVGMPAEELPAGQWLSILAAASKTAPDGCDAAQAACHHQGPTSEAILQALRQIAIDAAICRYEIPGNIYPEDSAEFTFEVQIGSQKIARDVTHKDGWDYDKNQPEVIQFHGQSCEFLRQNQGSKNPEDQVWIANTCVW